MTTQIKPQKQLASSEIINISPAMASAWLGDSKFDNRKLDDKNVDKIARDIKSNKWVFDGNPIRFDTNGDVIDGQHRLWAIIKAEKSVQSIIVRGLAANARDIIDTGKARTVTDVLHFNGHQNNALLAATCRMAIGCEKAEGDMMKWARSKANTRLSNQEILEKVARDKALSQAVSAVLPLHFVRKFLGGSVACFAYYHLKRLCSKDAYRVDSFFLAFEKGENLATDDIILLLRNTLSIRDMRAYYTKGGNIMSAYRLALVIKAWNAWNNKEKLQRLKFDGDIEQYPIPQSPKGKEAA